MHVNDEYGSHITNITTLEILWSISEQLKQTLKYDASKSHFSSLMINELTNQITKQLLLFDFEREL